MFRGLVEELTFRSMALGLTDPDNPPARLLWQGLVAEATPVAVLDLLDRLKWVKDVDGYADERRFLHGAGELDPGIDRWLVIAPQQSVKVAMWRCGPGFKIVTRRRRADSKGNMRYGVFSERRHRLVAEAIAKAKAHKGLTPDTTRLVADRTAVMLLYPTVETSPSGANVADGDVTIGFGLHFPPNDIKRLLVFSVRNKSRPEDVVVPVD